MPLNTVQTYLKQVLDGTQLPYQQGTLSAYISPPDPGDGETPSLYIWGSVGDENRMSMPRPLLNQRASGAMKKLVHNVDMWLLWFGPGDDPQADSLFPSMIDAVTGVLRSTTMPVLNLADPANPANTSNLDAIGEHLSWSYAPVHSTDDQRYLVYAARIVCDVVEVFQG